MAASIADRIVKTNIELDARIRALGERVRGDNAGRPRLDERYNAAELTPEQRKRFGFSADWAPRRRRPR